MPYSLDDKLVVAVASSALFDLSESHRVFVEQGKERYREYQRAHERDVLAPGVAFPFIRRLLSLNGPRPGDDPVEVVLLSQNDPDTGLRVFNSIESHGLDISRAAFVGGREPFRYMRAFQCRLFLSASEEDVRRAIAKGFAAGIVMDAGPRAEGGGPADDPADVELRIAFDFDGVLIDDEAETVFKNDGLDRFQSAESAKADLAHNPGPLKPLLDEISRLQDRESELCRADSRHRRRIRVAIVTARNAPAHKRVVTTLRAWGVRVDEMLFLGGVPKAEFLRIFRPHLFFDDQQDHIDAAADVVPSVHIPFGVANPRARRAAESA